MTRGGLAAQRRLATKLAAPVVAQGITAATSLMLQVVAAHSLGLADFGAFALFLAMLVTATAIYTGYIGDGLTVLDRHEPTTRSALVTSAAGLISVSAALAVGASLVIRHGDGWVAAGFMTTVVTWLARDTIRRLLIARQEFGRLVVNDLIYMVATLTAIVAVALFGTLGLLALFGAMTTGALVAITAGLIGLPADELRNLRPAWDGMRRVAAFATWRSAQATLRPASLLLARVMVANLLTLSAVGLLEAARLVIAPIEVIINGTAGFLLARLSAAQKSGQPLSGRRVAAASWFLFSTTLLAGGLLTALAGPVGRILTGETVNALVVLGWVAYLSTWAFGLPYVTEAVSRRLSRQVFVIRLTDSCIGLALTAIALAAGAGLTAVPWLIAVGGLYGAWRTRALAVASRQA